MILNNRSFNFISLLLAFAFLTATVAGQTTGFNFQGRLNDGANPANGNVELQFKLFDSVTGGNQIGAVVLRSSVAVINGVFSTQLDFGAAAFDGSQRFVEIGVRPAGNTSPFTILTPRQQILSAPYAIQAKNAAQLGGIDASQYVTTTTVGNSFIKNATVQQTGNFNISGNGVVGSNLGIGIAPNGNYKLEVNGGALFRLPGTGGNLEIGTPNSESGMSIISTGRADLRFDGTLLKLVAGPVGGPPPLKNGIVISTSGRVGIGTFNVVFAKLIVEADNGEDGIRSRSGGGSSFAVFSDGFLGTNQLGAGGNVALCINSLNQIAFCGSSLRYKTDLQPFGIGLSFINQLHPIAYKWKADNTPDIGFGAEDVAKINPLFVAYNSKGEVEGVKYDRLSVVFVNAFKEQQAQIVQQQKQLEQQWLQIENLKKLICLEHSNATLCQEK